MELSESSIHKGDYKKQIALAERIIKDYPDSTWAKRTEGDLRLLRAVGKPVVLEFDEAITGKRISLQKNLRGKIVVLDFWATWCGPCIREMPKMKELYKEFILKALSSSASALTNPRIKAVSTASRNSSRTRKYLGRNTTKAKVGRANFPTLGASAAIPRYFVIGPDGKIVSADARGKLETMLPELIKKAKGAANAGE